MWHIILYVTAYLDKSIEHLVRCERRNSLKKFSKSKSDPIPVLVGMLTSDFLVCKQNYIPQHSDLRI